jgi:hypothetical protein
MADRMSDGCGGREELARLLARPGGKLADQINVGIAKCVDASGEFVQTFGDLLDNSTQFGVAVFVLLSQLVRAEIDFGEQALKGAFKGFRLNVLKACLQRIQELTALRASHIGDAVP